MSDVGALVGQALAQDQLALKVQTQVSVLKQSMDMQEEAVLTLLQSMGIGQNLDVQA